MDGVKTADPRLVPEARTMPEISYNEAAELAYFGAKVLHPNTLRPVTAAGVPVWIRNSFAPEQPGTRITARGRSNGGGVKALTAIRDVTMITVGGPGIVGLDRRAGAILCRHGGFADQRALCFAIIFAKRYLLRDSLRGRESAPWKRSATPSRLKSPNKPWSTSRQIPVLPS